MRPRNLSKNLQTVREGKGRPDVLPRGGKRRLDHGQDSHNNRLLPSKGSHGPNHRRLTPLPRLARRSESSHLCNQGEDSDTPLRHRRQKSPRSQRRKRPSQQIPAPSAKMCPEASRNPTKTKQSQPRATVRKGKSLTFYNHCHTVSERQSNNQFSPTAYVSLRETSTQIPTNFYS